MPQNNSQFNLEIDGVRKRPSTSSHKQYVASSDVPPSLVTTHKWNHSQKFYTMAKTDEIEESVRLGIQLFLNPQTLPNQIIQIILKNYTSCRRQASIPH